MDYGTDFILEYGSSIVLKKVKGNKLVEFRRHSDPVLDNIVEMWKYTEKSAKKGKSTWIILKDLPTFLSTYLNKGEYKMKDSGTINTKNNKKL